MIKLIYKKRWHYNLMKFNIKSDLFIKVVLIE